MVTLSSAAGGAMAVLWDAVPVGRGAGQSDSFGGSAS